MKRIILILICVFFMFCLVSAENTSIMYGQNESGAQIPLQVDSTGRLKINLNFLNITSGSIASSGNLTIGERITFALGETIDNVVDGWVRITGDLNVTSTIMLGGKVLSNNGGKLKWGGVDIDTNVSVMYAQNASGSKNPLALDSGGALKLTIASLNSGVWEVIGGVTRLVNPMNVNISGTLTVYGDANITGDLYVNESSIYLGDKKISSEGGVLTFDGTNVTPTGMIVAFNLSSCPSGWTEANGSNGTPDLRGIFVRGAGVSGVVDYANGTDMSANYGEYLNDSLQEHKHNIARSDGALALTWNNGGSELRATTVSDGLASNPYQAYSTVTAGTAYGTPRTGAETAPASFALTYCVKETGSDYAEWIESSEEIWEGMIVSVDEENDNRVVRSKETYDKNILGVVSTQPGWIIGEETKTTVKLALVGQVPVRVVLENGEIKRGDAITSSSYIEGFGMKATEDKRIVGISLTELNEDSEGVYECGEELCGAVKVLLDLSWKNEENLKLRVEELEKVICEELGRMCE